MIEIRRIDSGECDSCDVTITEANEGLSISVSSIKHEFAPRIALDRVEEGDVDINDVAEDLLPERPYLKLCENCAVKQIGMTVVMLGETRCGMKIVRTKAKAKTSKVK